MKIHEYQAKGILAKFGVPVPRGEVVFKKDEARGGGAAVGNFGGCGEGANSRGRTREGRRREAGEISGRCFDAGRNKFWE